MTMSMPWDCTCEAPVDLEIDGDGAREVCAAGCGMSQKPTPPEPNRAEIRAAVRESRKRRMLGPSCFGRRHHQCKASRCECLCHDKEASRGAQA